MEYNRVWPRLLGNQDKQLFTDYLLSSVRFLYINDTYLLDNNVHEQALSHRLAHYFEIVSRPEFHNVDSNLSVDTEYNKNFDEEKKLFKHCPLCLNNGCYIKNDSTPYYFKHQNARQYKTKADHACDKHMERGVRPDFILHNRGSNNSNILVLESKKKLDLTIDSNKADIIYDFMRLSYFTCSFYEPEYANDFIYKYRVGCFALFDSHTCDVYIFDNGKLLGRKYRLSIHQDRVGTFSLMDDDLGL